MADCEQDIEDIKQELHETGYLKKAAGRKGKKNLARSKPLEFTTSEGVKGLIGKNNIQNDQLTFQMARPQDIWLHVKDIHGSHVILRTSQLQYGSDYTERTLLEGAAQAAAHSKDFLIFYRFLIISKSLIHPLGLKIINTIHRVLSVFQTPC